MRMKEYAQILIEEQYEENYQRYLSEFAPKRKAFDMAELDAPAPYMEYETKPVDMGLIAALFAGTR
jgi:hypothetical protein